MLCQHCRVGTFQRDEALRAMATTSYDLVVIGAGMTGAGVALDAASRGLKVALIDSGDVACGTSSKSSKMVHGGLRYLQQREFRLVYENLRERQRLLANAPFLVRPLPFLVPLFGKNGVASKALVKGYGTALRLYDVSGGWRIGQRHKRISREDALRYLPTLNAERLVAGFLYYDARGDDARVALALAKTAALRYDVDVATYVRATNIAAEGGRVSAVRCRNELSGETVTLATNLVVNATGVWADDVFTMAEHRTSERITPAKGVHLSVANDRLPATVAAVLAVPGDRRSIFVVPFEEAPYTYIGTTDTTYAGPLDEPFTTPDDVAYLLAAVNAWTSSNLTPADVVGLWAGLRPLLAPLDGKRVNERTADLSRRHQVTDSHVGVLHITGGKWTTYRQMAEDTVDALRPYVPKLKNARTKSLRLHGVSTWRPTNALESHLYQRFGSDTAAILAMIANDPTTSAPLIEGLPYVAAEFLYSVRQEMTTSLIDLLTRRTRAHLINARATYDAALTVANVVARDMGWDGAEVDRQVGSYRALVEREFGAAGLSL